MKRIVFIGFLLLLVLGTTAFGQVRRITGTVTDASDGGTLPGVSIVVKGTTQGTVTDINGRYELNADGNATLLFSFIGMVTQEIPVAGRNVINVSMASEMVGLDEVIVIAYGTTRRESFTGVADVISAEKIERRQVSNITKALEGTSPGIQVTSGGGQPGAGAAIRLRGFGSISADNAPLYVVDGMPFDGNLNAINPDDIASITVLRDASAAALYGARGANGVIMITTKKGDARKPVMGFTSRVGFTNRAIPEYPRVNSGEYMLITWEALRNAAHFGAQGLSLEAANAQAQAQLTPTVGYYRPFRVPAGQNLIEWDPANPWKAHLNPNAELLYEDDWQDALFSTAIRQDHQFNVSGGTENSDYYMSFGYLNEDGLAVKSSFERISGRLNVNTRPTSWFETGLNLSTSLSETFQQTFTGTQTTNAFYFSRMMPPIYPIYVRDNDGAFVLDADGKKILDYGFGVDPNLSSDDPMYRNRPYAGNANLVGSLELDDRSYKRENLGARTFALFKIMDGLTFRANLSADYYSLYQTTFQNPQFGDAANVQGRGTKNFNRSLSITFNQLLNYSRQFGDHNFDFLLGHESYKLLFNGLSSTRVGFPVPGITEIGIATTTTDANSYQDEYAVEGYFTRLSYDYANRYYISGSFRRDGTSRFFEDSRWGNFFSVGASWRVTQEEFMQGLDWLDNLRVKASYGEQGNDRIGSYYAWQSFYALGWNNAGLSGGVYSTHENRNLVWESSNNTNVGFDFRVFDRLSGELDYFIRKSSNLLFNVPLPPSTGVTSIRRNIGEMENRGIEFRLMYDVLQRSNLRWNIDFNITHLKNEITKMPEATPEIISGTKKLMVGRSMYDYFLRETSRIDPETGTQYYFYDILDDNGDVIARRDTNIVAQATRYYVGSAIPDFWGGITNNFNFGNFDLSVLFTYSYGGLMYDGTYGALVAGRLWATDYGNHYHKDALNRWVQPGDETGQARLEGGNPDLYGGTSEDLLFDMSYLALKNVTFGYNIPTRLMNQIGVSNLRLFVSGDNLFIWNNNQGMDPQHSFTGTTDFGYVPVRTVTFGLNLQF
ncbi:MAG: TonB-dependent receptor [Bacteroidales bacterium]|nr:TonB-dependent receptor [Bacteroidales bacterium]